MTEHLPECPMSTKDSICRCLPCICDALRACEERVLKDTVPGEWHEKRMAWVRKDALDKAMEAVAELEFFRTNPATIIRPRALASIDALRRKP